MSPAPDDPDGVLLLVGIAASALSGGPGLFARRGVRVGERLATTLAIVDSSVGIFVALRRLVRHRDPAPIAAIPTWDWGYAQPAPRMQYTARSFCEWLAEHLLTRRLAPMCEAQRPEGLFPRVAHFSSRTPDPIYILGTAILLLGWAVFRGAVPP